MTFRKIKDLWTTWEADYEDWNSEQIELFGEYILYLRKLSPRNSNPGATEVLGVKAVRTFQRVIEGKRVSPKTASKFDALILYFAKVADDGVEVDDFETWLFKRKAVPSQDVADNEAADDVEEELSNIETDQFASSERSKVRWYWAGGIGAVALIFVLAVTAQMYWFPKNAQTTAEVSAPEVVRIDRPVYAQDIAAALENADIEALNDMASYGVTVERFETAFQTAAVDFFEKSKVSDAAAEWFEGLLASGFNPETRTQHERYEEVSLVYSAFEAGNVEAVKILLSAGASPHGYQRILGTRKPDPFFLFPAHAVSKAEHLTELEKIELLDVMFDHGVAFYEPEKITYNENPSQNGDSTWIVSKDELPNLFRLTDERPRPVVRGCEFERSRTRCLDATTATGKNWCSVMDRVPSVIFVEDYHQFRNKLISIEVQDLISVSDGSAYFFATHLNGSQGVYGVLEATPDEDIYSFISYGNPFRRSHICELDDDIEMNSWCWRDTPIRKTSETTGTIFDDINLKLFPTC